MSGYDLEVIAVDKGICKVPQLMPPTLFVKYNTIQHSPGRGTNIIFRFLQVLPGRHDNDIFQRRNNLILAAISVSEKDGILYGDLLDV